MEFIKKNIILILIAIVVVVFAAIYFMGSGQQAPPSDDQGAGESKNTEEKRLTDGPGDLYGDDYIIQQRKALIKSKEEELNKIKATFGNSPLAPVQAKIRKLQMELDNLKAI
jgi:autotransporter translocation and assembly factor TamB